MIRPRDSVYGVSAAVPPGEWNTLRLAAESQLFSIYLNDEKLFEVDDQTFLAPGRVGLWTKADSITYFDDLVAFSLER